MRIGSRWAATAIAGFAVIALLSGILAPRSAHAQSGASCPISAQKPQVKSGTSYTVVTGDMCSLLVFTSSSATAVSLPSAAAALPPGATIGFLAGGSGTVTITPTTSTINGGSTLVLPAGYSATIVSDGTNYRAFGTASIGTLASSTTAPSNQTGITGATAAAVMLGLGGATNPAVLTPIATGRISYTITGTVNVGTSGDGATLQCSYGTGTAPANNAALAGTQSGAGVTFINAASTTEKVPFACKGTLTGATIGTALWFDLSVLNITGGTATVSGATFSAHEF